MNILIFKTNVADATQVKQLRTHFKNVSGIRRWTVDLHDCDKVLRIESDELTPHSIENLLQGAGYYCKELDD